MVQHGFSGMRDESKNGGGMRDKDIKFNSGMQDENRTADRDMLHFVGGIRDRTSTIGRIIIKLKLRVTQYLFDIKNFHNP